MITAILMFVYLFGWSGSGLDTGSMVAMLTIDMTLLFWIDKIFF